MEKPRTPFGYRVMLFLFGVAAVIGTAAMLVAIFTSREYGLHARVASHTGGRSDVRVESRADQATATK